MAIVPNVPNVPGVAMMAMAVAWTRERELAASIARARAFAKVAKSSRASWRGNRTKGRLIH